MIQPLSAEIFVQFDGSHLDLSRLTGGGEDCKTDLAAIYLELFNRMRENGIHFQPPADNMVSWAEMITGPNGEEALAGWDQDKRLFAVRADLALVPELVRDVVAHEMVHQIISEYPQPFDHHGGGHGDRFYRVACLVAGVLDMPMPQRKTAMTWPTLDRPAGYYGPLVQRRAGMEVGSNA